MELVIDDPDAMRELGAALGRVARAGDTVGLCGDLGAGKTVFVQGLAGGLGATGPVTSPTFTIIHTYAGGRLTLHHADLYRLDHAAELEEIGLDDIFAPDAVAAVEWADKLPGVLPADALVVRLEGAGTSPRRLTAAATGPRSTELLARWAGGVSRRTAS